jgi:hypothetical protein
VLALALLAAVPLTAVAAPPGARERPRAELPGKPTGPIDVDYRLAAEPAVGVPLAITITARVEAGAAGLRLEITASEPNAVLLTVPTLVASAASTQTWRVTVVPLAADSGYLNAVVAGEIDGEAQARTVTIALRGAAAAPEAAPPAAPGEALIALPVQETPY